MIKYYLNIFHDSKLNICLTTPCQSSKVQPEYNNIPHEHLFFNTSNWNTYIKEKNVCCTSINSYQKCL